MAEQSILTEDTLREIGREAEPVVLEIDKTLIRRFAAAVEDTNPLWTDEEVARYGPYGGLIAPPNILYAIMATGSKPPFKHIEVFESLRGLDAGGEWEYYQPIRLGDTITSVSKLVDMTEKHGRLGAMIFVTCEVTFRNQRQELVAKARTSTAQY